MKIDQNVLQLGQCFHKCTSIMLSFSWVNVHMWLTSMYQTARDIIVL